MATTLLGERSTDSDILSLNKCNLKNSDEEIILGIAIDRKLKFNKHIKNICKKGITKPCTHLHPALSTSTQLILASPSSRQHPQRY